MSFERSSFKFHIEHLISISGQTSRTSQIFHVTKYRLSDDGLFVTSLSVTHPTKLIKKDFSPMMDAAHISISPFKYVIIDSEFLAILSLAAVYLASSLVLI